MARILVACECSRIVSEAFEAKGHYVLSCDLLPPERPGNHYQGDVRDVLYKKWDVLIAHPVCTRLTNSGVRWLHVPPKNKTLKQMWEEFYDACAFYKLLRDAPIEKKGIENPIFHRYASNEIKPGKRQIIQPWWFGEPFFKATGFELIGLPPLQPTNILTPPRKGTDEYKKWSYIHYMSPGKNRAKNRSRFFPGVAAAMADQWSKVL